ncbi:MAG TPA: hypothetical protein VHV74_15175 [Pseudonocardiaceae bacterium]|nr:hypothetical protein [Pseudonocardiaceae bacterium]
MSLLRAVLPALLAEVLLTYVIHKAVGTPVAWSILVALPVAAFVMLLLTTPPGIEPSWSPPPEPPSVAAHLDASTLTGRLEDAVRDQSRFRTRIQPRLAALALGALKRKPGMGDLTGLDDPRAREALGDTWHTVLTHPSATLPGHDELLALLAYLEEQ